MTQKLITDPMTGEPWTLCGTNVTTAPLPVNGSYARCGGCGRPVTVNAKGVWVYA